MVLLLSWAMIHGRPSLPAAGPLPVSAAIRAHSWAATAQTSQLEAGAQQLWVWPWESRWKIRLATAASVPDPLA